MIPTGKFFYHIIRYCTLGTFHDGPVFWLIQTYLSKSKKMIIIRGEISFILKYLKTCLVERSLGLNSKSLSFCPPFTYLGLCDLVINTYQMYVNYCSKKDSCSTLHKICRYGCYPHFVDSYVEV